ncbi:T9SS type A sorting domain-containing protein [Aequorivita sublithincola]
MSNEKTIDISSLVLGVYIVRIAGDKGYIAKNLVKQ